MTFTGNASPVAQALPLRISSANALKARFRFTLRSMFAIGRPTLRRAERFSKRKEGLGVAPKQTVPIILGEELGVADQIADALLTERKWVV
jgi:hypothetical protein